MNFDLNDEQAMLRDTVRELLGRAYDTETRNSVTATDLGWNQQTWKQLADMGVLGLPFAEADGGMGAGPVETMTVMNEIGRSLAPEPFFDVVVLCGGLLAEAGSAAQRSRYLPLITEGSALLSFAHSEPGSRWPHERVDTVATSTASGWTLTGTKNPVLRGDCADTLIVSAKLPDGATGLFIVETADQGVTRKTYATYDGLHGAQIEFISATADPIGNGGDATALIARAQIRAQVALCAEALGAMEEALRLTTEYLKQRKQFGVPLASFQTLTQRAADMYVSLELASSMTLYATMSLADGVVDPTIASRTKLQVSEAARHIGQESIQMHGGIGLTAEYPVGHYVSRLTAIGQTLGSAEDHLRFLASQVGSYDMVRAAG